MATVTVYQSDFSSTTDGWIGVNSDGYDATLSLSNTVAGMPSGASQSLRIAKPNSAMTSQYAGRSISGLTVGNTYTFNVSLAETNALTGIMEAYVSEVYGYVSLGTSTATWKTGSFTFVATETIHTFFVGVSGASGSTGRYVYVDNVSLTTDATVANVPPTASFTKSATDLNVTVDASASTDPDGSIVSYAWNWGDGTAAGSGVTAAHSYASAGTYTITLVVTDSANATAQTTSSVTVTAPSVGPVRPNVVKMKGGTQVTLRYKGQSTPTPTQIVVTAGTPKVNGANSLTCIVPVPASASGECSFIAVSTATGDGLTGPSGWTPIIENFYPSAGTQCKTSIFYRFWQPGDATTMTVTANVSSRMTGAAWKATGLNVATPIEGGTWLNSGNAPSMTVDKGRVLICVFGGRGYAASSTWEPPEGMIELVDICTTYATAHSTIGVNYQAIEAGDTGERSSAKSDTSGSKAGAIFALIPA